MNADTRRYTPINQRHNKNISLTKMVNLIFQTTPGFIGVHRLEVPTFGGVFGGSIPFSG